ncbi:MAG: DUF4351 domain-containing protein [Cyanobacteria bacterium P01_F01_bin.42]
MLTQTDNHQQTLQQVATKVNELSDTAVQNNVAATAAILAGLSLDQAFINQVLRKDIMQQSVIYQEWREEFLEEGRQAGIQAGEQSLILRLLTRRFDTISDEVRSQVSSLSLEQLGNLGDALLDFEALEDLEHWLQRNEAPE